MHAEGFNDREVENTLERLFDALSKNQFKQEQFRILWWRDFCRALARKRLGEDASIAKIEKLADQYSSRLEVVSLGIAASAIWEEGLKPLALELGKIASEAKDIIRKIAIGPTPPLKGRISGAPGPVWDYILHGSGLKWLIHPSQRFIIIPPRIANSNLVTGTAPFSGFEVAAHENALWLCQVGPNYWQCAFTPSGVTAVTKYGIPGMTFQPLAAHTPAASPFADWSLCHVERLSSWDIDIMLPGSIPIIFVSIRALEAFLEAKINGVLVEPTDSQFFAAPP